MRQSAILMHITSLPGPYGIGTMGKQAFAFVDFLKKAGQQCWQILPLNPTGYGDSPYQSCSSFAGNHYLIDLDLLIGEGLLRQEEVDAICWCDKEEKVNYGLLYNHRLAVLRLAYGRFEADSAFDDFCRENADWLPDFALYMALKDREQGKAWYQWEDGLKRRDSQAIWEARQELKEDIRFYSFVQFLFYRQWNALRDYAHENGVSIIGDVPIYVPYDSVDVWSSPECFQLDEMMVPTAVAGCPPDDFCDDGQLWGNPLYRWETMEKDGYSWWLRRLAAAGKMYDTVRLDHFRGFEAYWSVPYGDPTAKYGKWVKGPSMNFMNAIRTKLPKLSVIAEDLGFLTQEVLDMRDTAGFPGMKILSFAFYAEENSEYLPHLYPQNCVCYPGTHDNATMREWFDTTEKKVVDYAKSYMHLTEEEGLVWGVIRTAFASVANLCVIPMQDYLDLGGVARMNNPGTLSDVNWTWRVHAGFTDDKMAKRIYDMTKLYGRLGDKTETP